MEGPARITAIAADPRDARRVKVRSGRRVVATLDADDAHALGLCEGMVLEEALLERVEACALRGRARREAIRLIAARAYTRRGLMDRLRRRFDAEDAEAAVAHVEALGLIDDRAFAEAYLRGQVGEGAGSRSAGPRLLEAKLRQRGVEGGVARRAVTEAVSEVDLGAEALRLAERRAGLASVRALEPEVARRRVYGYLARRGFDAATCAEAVRRAIPS